MDIVAFKEKCRFFLKKKKTLQHILGQNKEVGASPQEATVSYFQWEAKANQTHRSPGWKKKSGHESRSGRPCSRDWVLAPPLEQTKGLRIMSGETMKPNANTE